MKLNELIFTLEGLINLEKADARAYKTYGFDYYQLPIAVDEIASDGEYVYVHSSIGDEMVNHSQMNNYLQTCISHINTRFEYYSQLGMVDATASINFYAGTIKDPTYYGTGLNGSGDNRTHYCTYYLGTANY
jgi:hypothetical protein